jgi:L-cystine transport system substrate-binding protein
MKRRKLLQLLVSGLVVASILAGCGSSKSSNTSVSDTDVKKVKVAFDQSLKPIAYVDDGNLQDMMLSYEISG